MTARPPAIEDPQLMTPAEVGEALHVTAQTVNRWCRSGAIPLGMITQTPGGSLRIRGEWVRSLLADVR